MLTRKEFDEFMIDYLEGGLPVWQKFMCWLHLKMCRESAHFIRQVHRVIAHEQRASDCPDGSVPDSVPEELVKAAMAHRKAK